VRVVGAGLGRTGTASLKLALERLLDGKCHHMFEVKTAEHAATWRLAAEGQMPDWSEFLGDYVALVDWPGASFWPELAEAYPEALVLLSTRDLEKWYDSASATIFKDRPPLTEENTDLEREGQRMWKAILADRFEPDLANREATMSAAKRHNEAVLAGIAPDRLLCWSPGDGWEPICAALGLPIPDEPFPLTNTREQFIARREQT